MNQTQIFKHDVLRFPRLDSVLMVEVAIKNAKGDKTLRQIWQKLPKKMMWQTYLTTLDYLEYSGKIYIDSDKHAIWIWAPKDIKKLKQKGLVME